MTLTRPNLSIIDLRSLILSLILHVIGLNSSLTHAPLQAAATLAVEPVAAFVATLVAAPASDPAPTPASAPAVAPALRSDPNKRTSRPYMSIIP